MIDRGIFMWQVPTVEKGDPARIAALLKSAGIKRLDVKVAEADKAYSVPRWSHLTWGINVRRDFVRALQGMGIVVYGWGFCYGNNPIGEGMIAARQVSELNLDGYIFNPETRFEKQPSAGKRAEIVVKNFRDNAPDVPAALCTWPLWDSPWSGAKWHDTAFAKGFMTALDYAAPEIYWWNTHATLWFHNTIKQWRELITDKPIMPVGRAYSGEGMGQVNPGEIRDFGALVREYELLGESFWNLRIASARADVWEVISNLSPLEPPPPPPVAPLEEVVDNLVAWARKRDYDGPGRSGAV